MEYFVTNYSTNRTHFFHAINKLYHFFFAYLQYVKVRFAYDFSNIPSTNKNVPTTLARCEDEEKQCLSG